MLSTTTAIFSLAAVAQAHFFIQDPSFLGFDDTKMTQAPCGGFSPTTRDGASDFSVGGSPIAILTTHGTASWEYHAALISNPTNFIKIYPSINQKGLGDFCLPSVTIPSDWAGKDGVIQVIQHAHDGDLHQCSAVRFISGGPEAVPASCKNGTGVSAEFQTPPTPPTTSLGNSANPPASTAKPTSKHDHGDHSHPHHESGHDATESGGHAHPTSAPSQSQAQSQSGASVSSKTSGAGTGPIPSGTAIVTTRLPSGTSRGNGTAPNPTGSPPAQFTGGASLAGLSVDSTMPIVFGVVFAALGWAL